MLNIFKSKLQQNKFIVNTTKNEDKSKGITKYYSPAVKEWYNSIYSYNKNYNKLLPIADNIIMKLITSYFNMYMLKLNRKIRISRTNNNKRKLTSKKIWISKSEVKHTGDKVIINLFVYDRNRKFFILKMENVLNSMLDNNNILNTMLENKNKSNVTIINSVVKSNKNTNLWNYIMKYYKENNMEYINSIKKESNGLLPLINSTENATSFQKFEDFIKLNFIKKILRKEIYIFLYKQIISLNNFKYTNIYLTPLLILLNKIYNKKVLLNIVKLKNYFLNSDILTQIIVSKIKNRRIKSRKALGGSIKNITIPKLDSKFIMRKSTKLSSLQNYIIRNKLFINKETNKDKLNEILKNFYLKNDNKNYVINNLKYKIISGIRLKTAGRLTKRFTAERAIIDTTYLGSIKEINSSYKGLSSTIVAGTLKPNIQFTKLQSKTRIGAFGLKGWIAGM